MTITLLRRVVLAQAGSGDWIGVDFDATLAYYDEWRGPDHAGAPIWPMINRVRQWLADGTQVKIMTARADDPVGVATIKAFCVRYFGRELPVTNVKDRWMLQLWDDRAVGVVPNEGRPVETAGTCVERR